MLKKQTSVITFFTLLLIGAGSLSYGQGLHYDDTSYLPENMTLEETLEGMVFADKDGLTLYTFDADNNGISSCYEGCLGKWRPFYSQKKLSGKHFSTVKRKGGRLQMRYKNQPLYLWVEDTYPGDMEGNNFNGAWHVVPAPALAPR